MVCTRNAAADYDEWEALGNPGWSYKDMFPYFKKIETFHTPPNCRFPIDPNAHGDHGDLNISYGEYTSPISYEFIDACVREGFGPIIDLNNSEGKVLGTGRVQAFLHKGERVSASSAFIPPELIRARKNNLYVTIGCHVTRILFEERDGEPPRAVGVEFKRKPKGPIYKVFATSEVILSAGTIHSPHILLLSGIGDEAHLREHGIRPVVHLPGVGRNLLDHLSCSLNYIPRKGMSIHSFFLNPIPHVLEWMRHRTGLVTSNLTEASAFWRVELPPSSTAGDSKHYEGPNVETLGIIGQLGCNSPNLNMKKRFLDFYTRDYYSICVILLKPNSVGRITLASADPFDMPVVNPNYLEDERDRKILVEAVRRSMRVGEDLKRSGMILRDYCVPQTKPNESEEEAIRRHIELQSDTMFHPTSTCKMGPDTDPMAVVDGELRLRGVKGLRVVDCSVFPSVPAGHTSYPVMAVAERASEFILKARRASQPEG
ncbi:uncharacterized protein VTP21DRAFT_11109 [Calcarisporiella thermophila]|uniref:uncharacterized protein n=1 Tax=Calcarisporiella thermophila TaxID=911321 RepID=UPI003743B14B